MSKKPVPVPTNTSRIFWDGLKQNKIMIQQCESCNEWVFYPRIHCPHCFSKNLAWRQISGKGSVYAYTVAHIPTLPEFKDETPQLLAVIELEEGVRVNSTLVNIAAEKACIGLRVKPIFEEREDTVLLRFTADA